MVFRDLDRDDVTRCYMLDTFRALLLLLAVAARGRSRAVGYGGPSLEAVADGRVTRAAKHSRNN